MKLIPVETIFQIINSETEFEGKIPDELFEKIKQNKEVMQEAFIKSIQLTKKSICNKINDYIKTREIVNTD